MNILREDKFKQLIWLALFCFLLPTSVARPKIGLALGGGGAKGSATIGALKVIEESGIKIDYIAGTSIGAVIGGLYAAGLELDEIDRLVFTRDAIAALDIDFLSDELRKLLLRRDCENLEETLIPFRCVAVDADKMKEEVLSEGRLWKAIIASMSVPVVYPLVPWKNKPLCDGGLLNNLPVDVVKAMGADIVIAIDLQQNADDGLQIPSLGLGGIFDTIADWSVTRPDKKKYNINVKAANIYIHPNLSGYNATSFGRANCREMKKRGENEARKHWDKLIRLKKS